jgi:hypothetical protein
LIIILPHKYAHVFHVVLVILFHHAILFPFPDSLFYRRML